MRKLGLMNAVKKLAAGSLAAVLVISGLTLVPKAAESNTVWYERIANATEYWTENKKTAPVKDGYVFGGWYSDENGASALESVTGEAYAKWVPATVLSVRTQSIASGSNAVTDSASKPATTDLRLLSAVDSTNYKHCGFQLLYGDKEVKPTEEKQITKVYKNISFGNDGTMAAKETFGEPAEYFFALNITPIYQNSFASKIYVRPYWVTLDGTTVYGLAKNVRVEDHYTDYDYYSMSVNLFGNQSIAAGKVTVTYDADKYSVVGTDKGIETGKVLEEMSWDNNAGTITIVGNGKTVNGMNNADGLFINIRLQPKENVTERPSLQIQADSQFCDWNEADVTGVIVQ